MGANLMVTPKARSLPVEIGGLSFRPVSSADYIPEAQLPKIKSTFWQLNITGFSPSLKAATAIGGQNVPVEGVWFRRHLLGPDGSMIEAGLRTVNSAWKVDGQWIDDRDRNEADAESMVGGAIAKRLGLRPGGTVRIFGQPFTVAGIVSTGGDEEDRIFVRMEVLQRLVNRPGQVDSVQVGALTKPEDEFARKDPARMTPKEYDRWYCTPYISSIAHQIEEALPMAVAKPIWRVADNEGKVLAKIRGLMLLISLAALVSAGLTVWSVMATTVLERRAEIGIMQATGASNGLVAALFSVEVALEGAAGGLIGSWVGLLLADWVGRSVFSITHCRYLAVLGSIVVGSGGAGIGGRRGAALAARAAAGARRYAAGRRIVFWTFVTRAVRFRERRLALAFAALAVAATLATALFSVYSDIERKMRVQFRGYGANIVISPAAGARTVPLSAVALAEKQGAAAAPFIYTVGSLAGEPVVVAGTDFERARPLTSYWHVDGARAATAGECLVGSTVAAHFRLQLGQQLKLEGAPCTIRGIISSGGTEDAQVILRLEAAARLADLHDAASVVQVRADGASLPAVQAALAHELPGADVRVLHAVAETEANVVLKIRSTLFLLTALILGITTALRQQ